MQASFTMCCDMSIIKFFCRATTTRPGEEDAGIQARAVVIHLFSSGWFFPTREPAPITMKLTTFPNQNVACLNASPRSLVIMNLVAFVICFG